jgi:EAL domain-containing protein (putative c-di-GMP-specific phosphodiesterase class I)
VLEQACHDLHRWQRHDHHDGLEISVNISAQELMAPDFASTVSEVLSASHTAPELLTLDVTESIFIQDSDRALVVLEDLKHIGVRLALDDFGTGYSSLSYLKRFPVDTVKIDQNFIADLERDPASRLIVSAVVQLAHDLQRSVVAEGVETAELYADIAALGCESYQGFYFARPMSADNFDTLLSSYTSAGGPMQTASPALVPPTLRVV